VNSLHSSHHRTAATQAETKPADTTPAADSSPAADA